LKPKLVAMPEKAQEGPVLTIMSEPFEGDLHAGLSGLGLGADFLDLGDGISLKKKPTRI